MRRRVAAGAAALLAGGLIAGLATPAGAQGTTGTSATAGAQATTTTQATAPIGAYSVYGAWTFKTQPNLHPPKLTTDAPTDTKKLAKGDFLLANFPNIVKTGPMTGQSGPLLLDNKLQPVWFQSVPTNSIAMDLKQLTYQGKPVLSWWQGTISKSGAAATGKLVVVNEHYKHVATITGQDGWVLDEHDAEISGNDVWVPAYRTVDNVNLSGYGGATNGTVYDFAVQEYDLKTGKLLYTWDAYNPGGTPNVPLSDSEQSPPAATGVPWDAYHGNSLQLVGKHDFLVSMRNTWAVYLVNIKTGKVVWTLGGKHSTFPLTSKDQFEWQHDVMLNPHHVVSIFDDHCCEITGPGQFAAPTGPTRALILKIDTKTHTASLVHAYTRGPNFHVAFTGSTQILKNGNVVVGWGSQPYFSEYTSTGKLLLDGVLPGKDLSYRALFTSTWVGKPSYPPAGVAVKTTTGKKSTVYASWNGATQVVAWRVLAGTSKKHLKTVATKKMTSFETTFPLKHVYKVYEVQALGHHHKVLRSSKPFTAPTAGFY